MKENNKSISQSQSDKDNGSISVYETDTQNSNFPGQCTGRGQNHISHSL